MSGGQPLASAAPTAAAAPRGSSWARERAETALSLGFVTGYLTLIVVPWPRLCGPGRTAGPASGCRVESEAVAALKLSVIWAARRWSAMLGTITAWVLVRDRFPGGRS